MNRGVLSHHLAPTPAAPPERPWRRRLGVGALFATLTLLATWPQILHMAEGVRDGGDPLFNSWVLAWNAHTFKQGEFFDLFDANIFYPHRRTLAYSEHLFPQSLLAAPVLWASSNPILAHNIIFLLSFFTSGLGMYALAFRLTRATAPSILAGVVFAFCPTMFDHLSHVQVLAAGGIPLSFLFLDRFLNQRRWPDLALFAAVFTTQILANGYYALFLSLAVGMFLLIELPRRGLLGDRRVWRGLVLAGILVSAATIPFFRQYVLMQREMGFKREIATQITLRSFATAPRINRLYGSLSAPWRSLEGQLFPGLTAVLLGVMGAVALARQRGRLAAAEKTLGLGAAVALGTALIAFLLARPTPQTVPTSLLPERLAMLAALLAACAVLAAFFRSSQRENTPAVGVYVVLGLVAFTLTFGTHGPYRLLHAWVPGFDGIRAVSRVHVLTMLALALLVAFGAKALREKVRGLAGGALLTLVGAGLAVEYASVPVPLTHVSLDGEEKRVYRWIARHTGSDEVLLELPFPRDEHEWWQWECRRLLAATLHFRPMVNGFSGLSPPLYQELQRRWRDHPLIDNLVDARTLGVRYLIVHRYLGHQPWMLGRELAAALLAAPGAKLVQIFPAAWVFQLDADPKPTGVGRALSLRETPGASLKASINAEAAPLATDGRLHTRWTTGRPQQPGDEVLIDLARPRLVTGVRLHLGRSPRDFPRGWELSTSGDGVTWQTITSGHIDSLPLSALVVPSEPRLELSSSPTTARFLRLTGTTADPVFYWSIHELEVLVVD